MKRSFTISNLIFKLWLNNLKKILNTRFKTVIAIFVLALVLVTSSFIISKMINSSMAMYFDGDSTMLYVFAVSFLITASIFCVILFITMKTIIPDSSEFASIVNWLPLKSLERRLGYLLPMFLLIIFVMLSIDAIIFIPIFFINHVPSNLSIGFFAILLMQIVLIISILQIFYTFFEFIVSIFRLPFQKYFTLISVLAVSSLYIFKNIDFKGILNGILEASYNLMFFFASYVKFFVSDSHPSFHEIITKITLLVLILFCLFLSLFIAEPIRRRQVFPLLWFIPSVRNKIMTLILIEFKNLIRNEENLFGFIVIGAVLFFARINLNLSEWREPLMIVFSGFGGVMSQVSYGGERTFFQIYKILPISKNKFLIAKILGQILTGLLSTTIIFVILGIIPSAAEILKILLILLNSIFIFYLLGLVIPIDKKNPYMAPISLFSLTLIIIPAIFLQNYISETVSCWAKLIVLFLIESVIVFTVLKTFYWRYRGEN